MTKGEDREDREIGKKRWVQIVTYINPVVSRERTLGSISCNPTTYRPLRPIPLSWVPLEKLQGSDSILATIAPHWSSSYPEYLNQNQSPEEQQSVVWSRLCNHQATVAKRLSKEKERYLAARRELNPRSTQAESSHESLSRDSTVSPEIPQGYPWQSLNMYSTHNVVIGTDNIDKLHMYLLCYNKPHLLWHKKWRRRWWLPKKEVLLDFPCVYTYGCRCDNESRKVCITVIRLAIKFTTVRCSAASATLADRRNAVVTMAPVRWRW